MPGRSDFPAATYPAYPDTGAVPSSPPPAWNRNPADPGPAPSGYGYPNNASPVSYSTAPSYPSTDNMPPANAVPVWGSRTIGVVTVTDCVAAGAATAFGGAGGR